MRMRRGLIAMDNEPGHGGVQPLGYLLNKPISNSGSWNVLVVDDLFHTGATMDAVCSLLAQYDKISGVYVAALTWR